MQGSPALEILRADFSETLSFQENSHYRGLPFKRSNVKRSVLMGIDGIGLHKARARQEHPCYLTMAMPRRYVQSTLLPVSGCNVHLLRVQNLEHHLHQSNVSLFGGSEKRQTGMKETSFVK